MLKIVKIKKKRANKEYILSNLEILALKEVIGTRIELSNLYDWLENYKIEEE